MRKKIGYALFLLLAACGGGAPAQQTLVYTPPQTPGGRMCMIECDKARDYCRLSCDLDYRACYNDVQTAAQQEYDRYTRDRFGNHEDISLLPSDFEHPGACNAAKDKCVAGCVQPYNKCYTSCGGVISVTSSCQFLCFE